MKQLKTIELWSSLANVVVTVIFLIWSVLFASASKPRNEVGDTFFMIFFFLTVPSVLIAIGAYLQTVKNNIWGFWLAFIPSSLMAFLYAFLFLLTVLIGSVIKLEMFVAITPGVLAGITAYSALRLAISEVFFKPLSELDEKLSANRKLMPQHQSRRNTGN